MVGRRAAFIAARTWRSTACFGVAPRESSCSTAGASSWIEANTRSKTSATPFIPLLRIIPEMGMRSRASYQSGGRMTKANTGTSTTTPATRTARVAYRNSTPVPGPCAMRRAAVHPPTTTITAMTPKTPAGCSFRKTRVRSSPTANSWTAARTVPSARSFSRARRFRAEMAIAIAIRPSESSSCGRETVT